MYVYVYNIILETVGLAVDRDTAGGSRSFGVDGSSYTFYPLAVYICFCC